LHEIEQVHEGNTPHVSNESSREYLYQSAGKIPLLFLTPQFAQEAYYLPGAK
jgi:hypothetical protein